MGKGLKYILLNLFMEGYGLEDEENFEVILETVSTKAYKEILALVPEKKEPEKCCVGGHTDENCDKNIRNIAECKGYNCCIDEITKRLEGEG